jgi:hypothetical protein
MLCQFAGERALGPRLNRKRTFEFAVARVSYDCILGQSRNGVAKRS